MKKNPWTITKHKWKLKSGEKGGLYDLEGSKITQEDIDEAGKASEEDKKKIRMQYLLDKEAEENQDRPNVFRKYSI